MPPVKTHRHLKNAKSTFVLPVSDRPRKLTMRASASNILGVMSPEKSLLSVSTAGSQSSPNKEGNSSTRSSTTNQSFRLVKDPSKGIDYSS